MNKHVVLYFGDDPEVISQGEDFFSKKSNASNNFKLMPVVPTENFLQSSHIKSYNPQLILVDFTHPSFNSQAFLRQLNLFKHHEAFRLVVFAALFKDKEEMENFWFLKHHGLTYSFIKGNDYPILFADLYYITYDVNPSFPQFARAKNLDLKYEAFFPCLLTGINDSSVRVTSDVECDEDLKLEHALAGERQINAFPVEELTRAQGLDDSLISYTLSIPYPGPWEEVGGNVILKDTVETILSDSEVLSPDPAHCLLVDMNETNLFFELLDENKDIPLQLHFKKDYTETLAFLQPEIIVIEAASADNVGNLSLAGLLSVIKNLPAYDPLIIIFNSQTDTTHLREDVKYKRLLCHPQKCTATILSLLLKAHAEKSQTEETFWKVPQPSVKISQLDLKLGITITGISEHAISFISPLVIPMYTNLRFDVPVDCHLLIVPPIRELPADHRGNTYMGFIHGIDQKEANYLRKFVNQIIFSPLEKFERIKIKENEKGPEIESIILTSKDERNLSEDSQKAISRRRQFTKTKL